MRNEDDMEDLEQSEEEEEKQDEHWMIIKAGGVEVSDTAESLWDKSWKYFQWCDNSPIIDTKIITQGAKTGSTLTSKYKRPYTIKGLCLHCGIFEEYLRDIRQTKNKDSLYYQVVSRIYYIIHTQNLELAMVGLINPVITSKVLALDKDDVPTGTIRVEVITGLPVLSESESEVLEKLEAEMKLKELAEGGNS